MPPPHGPARGALLVPTHPTMASRSWTGATATPQHLGTAKVPQFQPPALAPQPWAPAAPHSPHPGGAGGKSWAVALTPPAIGPGHRLTHHEDDFVVLEFFWRRKRKKNNYQKPESPSGSEVAPGGARSGAGIPGDGGDRFQSPGGGKVEREAAEGSRRMSPSSLSPGRVGTARLDLAEHKDPMVPLPWGWNPTAVWCPGDSHCPRLHCGRGPATSIPAAGLSPRRATGGCGRLRLAQTPRAPGATPGSP